MANSRGSELYQFKQWRADIYSCLQRDPPSIPIKFQYSGKGAQRWKELAEYEHYISQSELHLLRHAKYEVARLLSEVVSHKFEDCSSVRVVDVGCGTGTKASALLPEIDRFYSKVGYLPIDISKELISMAVKSCSSADVEVHSYGRQQIDYETQPLAPAILVARKNNTPDLLLFLGNNLGNIENNHEEIIAKLSESLRSDKDFLLLGVELSPASSEVSAFRRLIRIYHSPQVVKFLSTALEPFGVVPLELDKEGCGRIRPILENSTIHLYFQFVRQKKVFLKGTGESRIFHKADRIHLARSHRFRLEELGRLLAKNNLETVRVWQGTNNLSAFIFCKKGN